MASSSLRRRGAVALSSILSRHKNPSSYSSSTFVPLFHSLSVATSPSVLSRSRYHWLNFSASFRLSSLSLNLWSENGEGTISPDEILFEGCDYNHWLITMDFPKDPKPTPEQMVETYVETLAKVVGSREEAMKRMYACSTTTYTGFQAVMTEEVSEKFRGLPGVVFILPDSYIDPVNKEYGGDKYEMGKITPRPPPVQYGRQGRYGDRNRNYDRPRYDRPRESMPMQHANPPYNNQGPSPSGGTNYGQQQPHSPQGHWQADGRNYTPQQTYNPSGQQGQQWPSPTTPQQTYNPPGQQGQQWQSPTQGHGVDHTAQKNHYQGERGGAPLSYQRDFNQDGRGNFATQEKGRFTEGQYGGHGGPGSFGGKGFTQGPSSKYGQYPGPQDGQNFQAGENRGNVHSEQPNLNIPGNFGKNQGQF